MKACICVRRRGFPIISIPYLTILDFFPSIPSNDRHSNIDETSDLRGLTRIEIGARFSNKRIEFLNFFPRDLLNSAIKKSGILSAIPKHPLIFSFDIFENSFSKIVSFSGPYFCPVKISFKFSA